MATIQIELPDATAQAAQAAGLLTPQALERLLSDALRTRSLTVLDNSLAKLAADPLPPMSEDEIQAEIEAHRAEKRAAARS
ncbi:MAG: hypothetical protein RJA63_1986 [Pseudomonadota bacterium]|jgi:hypothetical protein